MNRIRAAIICAILWLCGLGLAAISGDSKGLMQSYALALALASAAIVTMDALKQPRFLLSCYSVVMLAPAWFLYLEAIFEDGDCWVLPAEWVIHTLSYSAFFLLVFNIAYCFRPPRWFTQFHERNFRRVIAPAIFPLTGIAITAITFIVILSRYDFDWEWTKRVYLAGRNTGEGLFRRGGVGGVDVFFQPLEFMCSAVPTIAALSWVRFKNERPSPLPLKILVSYCAFMLIFVMFLSGTRSAMAVYLAGPAAVWLMFGRHWLGKLPHLIVTIAMFVTLMGIWEYQKRKRVNLLDDVESVQDIVSETSFNVAETHRDNNLYIFTLYNMYMPDLFPYEGYYDLYVYAVNPIPRAIWPGKPKGIQENLRTFRVAPGPVRKGPLSIGTASLSQSVVGDGHRMDQYFGIVVYAVLFGFLASVWDFIGQRRYLTTRLYFIIQAAWLFWMLWGFRAGFALVTGMYAVWGAYVLCYFAGKLGRPLSAEGPMETTGLQIDASRSRGVMVGSQR